MATVLVLAGTTEATELAASLHHAGHRVVSSFAGVTAQPKPRPGEVRVGGFGGSAGLIDYLSTTRVDAVIDATHPFADTMPWNCAAACTAAAVPLVRVLRPVWHESDGDHWFRVPTLDAAASWLAGNELVPVFLAVGKQSIGAFTKLTNPLVFRSIERIEDLPWNAISISRRGPFSVASEVRLFKDHRIGVLVTKNSGGNETSSKLEAARMLQIPVVVVDRPLQPDVMIVDSAAGALAWLHDRVRACKGTYDEPSA